MTRPAPRSTPPPDDGWQDQAACAGTPPALWFPARGETTTHAKAICAGCPVRQRCLEYALDNHIAHGVWGGVPERERLKMRHQRRSVA